MPLIWSNPTALDARTRFATVPISLSTAGTSLRINKESANLQDGSIFIDRSAVDKTQSITFGTGTTYSVAIGRVASSDDFHIAKWDGVTASSMLKTTTTDASGLSSLYIRFNDGSSNRFEQLQVGAADSGGTGKRTFVVNN